MTIGTRHRHLAIDDLSSSHLRKFSRVVIELKKLHRKYTFDDVSPGEKEPLGFSRAIMLAVDVAFRPFSLRSIPERFYCFLSFATFAPASRLIEA